METIVEDSFEVVKDSYEGVEKIKLLKIHMKGMNQLYKLIQMKILKMEK